MSCRKCFAQARKKNLSEAADILFGNLACLYMEKRLSPDERGIIDQIIETLDEQDLLRKFVDERTKSNAENLPSKVIRAIEALPSALEEPCEFDNDGEKNARLAESWARRLERTAQRIRKRWGAQ